MRQIQRSNDRPIGLIALAVIACPCHLPLIGVVLAGTAGGAWLAENRTLLFAVTSLLFVIALVGLWRRSTPSGSA